MADVPAGTVGVVMGDQLARYHGFTVSMANLARPAGTHIVWASGCGVVDNLNRCCDDLSGDWLFVMGDDHVFEADMLERLLERMYEDDIDVIAPLCLSRAFPFFPVAYRERNDRGGYVPLDVGAHEDGALVEVAACGNAGMVIRRRVLEKIGLPWFKNGEVADDPFATTAEDLRFCEEARALGFRVYVDLAVKLGHITSCELWPGTYEGEAGVAFSFGGLGRRDVFLPRGMLPAE